MQIKNLVLLIVIHPNLFEPKPESLNSWTKGGILGLDLMEVIQNISPEISTIYTFDKRKETCRLKTLFY